MIKFKDNNNNWINALKNYLKIGSTIDGNETPMTQYRGLKANLPALAEGQIGFCTDTKETWIGSSAGNMLVQRELQVGDFVNYDAGTWTQADLDLITASEGSPTVNNSADLPTTQGQFGGFVVGQSRNSNSTLYSDGDAKYTSGWRVWDILGVGDNKTVILVHAGHSEAYYHAYGNSETSINILRNRDLSMYLNSYASSVKFMTGEDYADWYNKNIENTKLSLTDSGGVSGLYRDPYQVSTSQDMLINHSGETKTGAYYWLATSNSSNHLYRFIGSSRYRYVGSGYNIAFGVRPLITIKDFPATTGGSGTYEDPWQIPEGSSIATMSALSDLGIEATGVSTIDTEILNEMGVEV